MILIIMSSLFGIDAQQGLELFDGLPALPSGEVAPVVRLDH
jgi:hypothetical protein